MERLYLQALAVVLTTFATVSGLQQCFQCVNIDRPDFCETLAQCSESMQCYVEEVIDSNLNVTYNLGCASEEVCHSLHGTIVGRRDLISRRSPSTFTDCFRCCREDFCNKAGCRDPCKFNPCLHGSSCVPDEAGGYSCKCSPSYTGLRCETAIDFCSSYPCMNGGICQSDNRGFLCQCPGDFTGKRCETAGGLECFDCHGVLDVNKCNHKVVCAANEKCFGQVLLNNGEYSYKLGCQSKQICDFFRNQSDKGTIQTGRRSSEITACIECCEVNHCNKNSCVNGSKAVLKQTCAEYSAHGHSDSGIYILDLNDGEGAMTVYCDMGKNNGGPWVVIQRRMDGSVNFNRTWNEYQEGFGNLRGEFWLGLDNIHRLTKARLTHIRFDLGAADGRQGYADYSSFTVGDAQSKYKMDVSGYRGNATDYLGYNNGYPFSTLDRDNEVHSANLAFVNGAWWYYYYAYVSLNADYKTPGLREHLDCFSWYSFPDGGWTCLKYADMKLR